jgi:hypothetical protein
MTPLAEQIWPLWIELSRARVEAQEFVVKPWESHNRMVQAAWHRLIQPENLAALESWASGQEHFNPTAREAAQTALEACRRLNESGCQ